MQPLFCADGKTPLQDSKGQQIKSGATVVHEFLGEAIARGTVPLDQGVGVNVMIDWIGPGDADRPKSVGARHLTIKFGAGFRTVQQHSGADFESGRAARARGENDAAAARLREDVEMQEPEDSDECRQLRLRCPCRVQFVGHLKVKEPRIVVKFYVDL